MESTNQTGADTFPLGLLNRPASERIRYFRCYKAGHRNLLKADVELMSALRAEADDETLIFVFGPPGVGKSTLIERIAQRLDEEAAARSTSSSEEPHAPTLLLVAPPPLRHAFDWKLFLKRAFVTLEEPLIKRLRKEYAHVPEGRVGEVLAYNQKLSDDYYRVVLEQTLKLRRVPAFIIDEAHHIGRAPTGKGLLDQMNVVKNMAKTSGRPIVLAGTYELLHLRDLSGQLCRRSVDVHFRRYGLTNDDMKAFLSTLLEFQAHLPLPVEPDLFRHREFCYVRSVGCIGVLKTWLARALSEALHDGERTITEQRLRRTALSVYKCETIAREAVEGERRIEDEGDPRHLLQLLGFELGPVDDTYEQKGNDSQAAARLPRPVQRLPKRDPVSG